MTDKSVRRHIEKILDKLIIVINMTEYLIVASLFYLGDEKGKNATKDITKINKNLEICNINLILVLSK